MRLDRLVWPLAIVTIAMAMIDVDWLTSDWAFFASASKAIFSDRALLLYVDDPSVQTGPLSLLAFRGLAVLPFGAIVVRVVFAGLGLLTLRYVAELRREVETRRASFGDVRLLIGAVLVAVYWGYLKRFGHLDDALVITLAAASFVMVKRERRLPAAVLIGLSIATKPWAVFLLPITLATSGSLRSRLRFPAVSVAIAALIWSPFVLADRRTLDALRPTLRLAPDSVLRLFGVESELPAVLRTAQLVAALVVAIALTLRGKPYSVLLAGVAVRIMLDPGTWDYYTPGLVVGALAWDLAESRSRLPWMTMLMSALLVPTWMVDLPQTRSIMRLAACLIALGVVLRPVLDAISERARAAGPTRPSPAPQAAG